MMNAHLNTDLSDANTTPAIPSVDALKQAYARGDRSFSGITLAKAKLQGMNLKGADFSYADFSGADFTQTSLRGVDLSYAVLRGSDLSNADLRGAMLIGTDLQNAVLAGANLKDADYDPQETRFPSGFEPHNAGMKSDRS